MQVQIPLWLDCNTMKFFRCSFWSLLHLMLRRLLATPMVNLNQLNNPSAEIATVQSGQFAKRYLAYLSFCTCNWHLWQIPLEQPNEKAGKSSDNDWIDEHRFDILASIFKPLILCIHKNTKDSVANIENWGIHHADRTINRTDDRRSEKVVEPKIVRTRNVVCLSLYSLRKGFETRIRII